MGFVSAAFRLPQMLHIHQDLACCVPVVMCIAVGSAREIEGPTDQDGASNLRRLQLHSAVESWAPFPHPELGM